MTTKTSIRLRVESLEVRSLLSTLLVSTTADDGPGSLRQAILDANAAPGADAIHFGIGGGHQVITLAGPLPEITDTVSIDGSTQPGFAGSPIIEINGNAPAVSMDGILVISAPGCAIKSLVLNNLKGNGAIFIKPGGDDFAIQGNYIGTDATGDVAVPVTNGVASYPNINGLIGGSGAGQGNVISGATAAGIEVSDTSVVTIQGNSIGTNAAGTAALPNLYGIRLNGSGVSTGTPQVLIGGTTPGAGNLISGNTYGTLPTGGGAIVQGNFVGTNRAGTGAIPNFIGIALGRGQVGGITPGAGNLISGNTNAGITGYNLVIQGNLIGTDVSGSVPLVPGYHGIGINFVYDSLIGGSTPAARNVISGNDSGILFTFTSTIQGNYIGVDVTGEHPVPNFAGVDRVTDCTIGGTTPGAGNVISGNRLGVGLYAARCLIQGNLIGTNQDGTRAIGNDFGIYQPIDENTIGGTAPGAGNLISGNGVGIWVVGDDNQPTPRPITIQGNRIGTDITGTAPLPNNFGIILANGTSGVLIGGRTPGSGNLIAYNNDRGVYVGDEAGGGGYDNRIIGNSIHHNVVLGIDLGNDGVTHNDSHAGQANGPNNWQNFPVVTPRRGGSSTQVSGTLDSTPNDSFTIDLYASTAAHPSGYGEGERWLGSVVVTTDATGHASFDVTLAASTALGEWITATATGPSGTSEFSQAALVTTVIEPVQIDVQQDPVNLAEQGKIAVAVLTTADFHAATMSVSTVRFAGAAPVQSALQDIDGDGDLDLVLHFRVQDTALMSLYERLLIDDVDEDGVLDSTQQVAQVSLTGETIDHVPVEGVDEVTLFLAGKKLRQLLASLFGH